MSLQSTVNKQLAFGVVGSFYDDSPRRVAPYVVQGGQIGYAYTVNASDPTQATVGGTGAFAGIAVNSKEYPITGLDASLAFLPGANAQLCTMGHVLVVSTTAITVGMAAFYEQATGKIQAATSGSTVSGWTEIPNSQFIFVSGEANTIGVLQLG